MTAPGFVESRNGTASSRMPNAPGTDDRDSAPLVTYGCRIKLLPSRLHEKASAFAARVNPANAPLRPLVAVPPGVLEPQALTILTSKYWGASPRVLSVSFMESAPDDLKARIVSNMNAWSSRICISFALTNGTGDVRISRSGDGYWSYLGTDISLIPLDRPTMSLQNFTMAIDESEYRRVVRHETGHTLGFPHEHMRRELVQQIDPAKAYDYFWRTQRWSPDVVDAQVLTPLEDDAIMGTPADEDSIMCYQLPGTITHTGEPIRGGTDINKSDYDFAGSLYPPTDQAPSPRRASFEDDWGPAQDVDLPS